MQPENAKLPTMVTAVIIRNGRNGKKLLSKSALATTIHPHPFHLKVSAS